MRRLRPAIVLGMFSAAFVILASCALAVSTEGLSGNPGGSHADAELAPDAPVPDAAVPDAGACPPGAFCDDFELGNLSLWSTKTENSAVAAVTSNVAQAGKFGLQVKTDGVAPGNRADGYVNKRFAPIVPATLAVRAWFFMVNTTSYSEGLVTWTHPLPSANGDASFIVSIGQFSGMWGVMVHNSARVYVAHTTFAPVVVGRWVCVELDAKLATTGHLNLYVNDTVIMSKDENTLGAVVDEPGSGYELSVGLSLSDGATAQTLYYDDVVAFVSTDESIATAPRIGCE